jgi:hypothetical protein
MTFAQWRNLLTTQFSERIPIAKRRMTVWNWGQRNRVRFSTVERDFSVFPKLQTGCGAPPSFCSVATASLISFIYGSRNTTEYLLPSNIKMKKKWNSTSTPHTPWRTNCAPTYLNTTVWRRKNEWSFSSLHGHQLDCTVGRHLVAKRNTEVNKMTELYWIQPE